MRIVQLTAYPDDAPVSLERCREYLRVDSTAHDRQIRDARDAAVRFFSKEANRALAPADFAAYLDCWPCEPLRITIEPVDAVASVAYRDVDGNEITIDDALLDVSYQGGRAMVYFTKDFTRPSLYQFTSNPITILFHAGYDVDDDTGTGDDPEFALDPRARQTILMLTQHWYENRGIARVGETVNSIETTARALIDQSMVFAF